MPFGDSLDYLAFSTETVNFRRFRLSERSEAFINAIRESAIGHQTEISSGTTLYRAQLGAERKMEIPLAEHLGEFSLFESIRPFSPERMKPLPHSAMEGRVNPKGIPCLYLADRADTAMSEVRPWRGAFVSIGTFKTTRDLMLVDCTKKIAGPPRVIIDLAPQLATAERLESENWFAIATAFAVPVTDADNKAQYAPTQMLAEVFKTLGFDGIKYQSLLTDDVTCGFSYALFNLNDADLVDCNLCEVKSITHEFSEARTSLNMFTPSLMVVNGDYFQS